MDHGLVNNKRGLEIPILWLTADFHPQNIRLMFQ